MSQQTTPQTTNQLESAGTAHVTPPSPDARRIVGAVLQQALQSETTAKSSHEEVALTTPGVLEALDVAVDEIEALKRSL